MSAHAAGSGGVGAHGIPPPRRAPPRSVVLRDTPPAGWGEPPAPCETPSFALGITTSDDVDDAPGGGAPGGEGAGAGGADPGYGPGIRLGVQTQLPASSVRTTELASPCRLLIPT